MYLPLVCAAHREMLNAYVDISYQEDSIEIFNGDVGIVTLSYMWLNYALYSHLISIVEYVVFLLGFTAAIYLFGPFIRGSREEMIVAWTLQGLVLLYVAYYFLKEIYQVIVESRDNEINRDKYNRSTVANRKGPKANFVTDLFSHFANDIWNLNDLFIVFFTSAGIIIRILHNYSDSTLFYPTTSPDSANYISRPTNMPSSAPSSANSLNGDTSSSSVILAIASVCIYFKTLYFMRPFASSGPLGINEYYI